MAEPEIPGGHEGGLIAAGLALAASLIPVGKYLLEKYVERRKAQEQAALRREVRASNFLMAQGETRISDLQADNHALEQELAAVRTALRESEAARNALSQLNERLQARLERLEAEREPWEPHPRQKDETP